MIDLQHFNTVHHWDLNRVILPPRINEDGIFINHAEFTWKMGAQKTNPFARFLGNLVKTRYDSYFEVYGPGLAIAEAHTKIVRPATVRSHVLIYPINERDASIRVAAYTKKFEKEPLNDWFLKFYNTSLEQLITKMISRVSVEDFDGDERVWNKRKYLPNPKIVKEDGPLLDFRKWYLRFWHKDYLDAYPKLYEGRKIA